MRLSKLYGFESIQKPLACYRLHGGNLSIIRKEKEIEELVIWLSENKCNLNVFDIKNIQKYINYKKFVNFKIEKNYKECLKMVLSSKINLFNIKHLILFFTPVILLKKFSWWYQD